jgi:glycerophosphoryl diester phosphodiesterase
MQKPVYIIFVLCIILFSCEKDVDYNIDNLNNNTIFILGHGGMGVGKAQYPLDSYESVEKAISMGADGSEIDVQITKDSVLVCYHDTGLEEATDESGTIYSRNWDEIKNAAYKESPYKLYKIASLEQVFQYSGGSGKYYTFDIKFKNPDQSDANRDIFQRALIRLIEKYNLEKRCSIESPHADFLESLEEKKAGLNLFIYTDFETALNVGKEFGFKGLTIKAEEISADQVAEAHSNGMMVAVFSATRRNHEEIISKNVDIIQTDDLEDLLNRLR